MSNTKRKSSSKRSINDSISKKISSKTGIKKEYVSKNVRQVSKLKLGERIVVIAFFLLGIGIGYFGINFMQRKDQFRLVNGEVFNVNVGEEIDLNNIQKYVVCISYGRNAIDSVTIEGIDDLRIDTSVETTYEVVYASTDFKYKNIKLTQRIIVSSVEESYGE